MNLNNRKNKVEKFFIQNLSIYYNGNLSMLEKEDCVALVSNIMAENGFKSYIAAINIMGLKSLKTPDDVHTSHSVNIINFKSKISYFRFMLSHPRATVFGNSRTYIGLSACFFGDYRIFMNHTATLPKLWWQRKILKFFLKRFDVIKAESEAEKRELLKLGNLDPERIVIIPIPIDHKYLSIRSDETVFNSLRKKFKLEKKDNILIFLAVMRMHKRPDTVLKAIKVLKNRGIKVKLLQVGKDGLTGQIGKSVMDLAKDIGVADEVTCTGRVSDEELRCLIQMSKVGIQSSEVEGQCIVAFEYAAVGIAECLSDIPSFEIFGEKILRHAPDDYKKLAKNIEFYIKNPKIAKSHSKANQQLVREKYDYKLIKSKMRDLLIKKKNKFKSA
ncbi:MAG: glycosyltransferase family 4 protein [Candidatus Woesearchaeota archaeon]